MAKHCRKIGKNPGGVNIGIALLWPGHSHKVGMSGRGFLLITGTLPWQRIFFLNRAFFTFFYYFVVQDLNNRPVTPGYRDFKPIKFWRCKTALTCVKRLPWIVSCLTWCIP